ncbi:MAG TPA: DNA polymerase [Candidatus Avidehalobacter gallistercoris]|uniref:DNA-directed DNA polymerase n=1 Tax=Candidatus Avidehalobacter gallistercoris TaxID=2840694 RepID=A0A9D1HL82_9FIRM|nr:DNA polymerase [Candidatus Avidehalobacter gallistercoris]
MHHLSIDLETYSSVPIAKAGAQKYIQSPDFEILLFAYSLDGGDVQIIDLAQGELLPQWLASALSDPQYIKHAYNASFEWGCLSKFMGTLPIDQWRCTMFHGLYCGYTAGLDATGKALGLPADKQKLSTGKALIRYFCVPCAPTKTNGGRTRNYPRHDPAKWALFKEYCIGDVTTEMEILHRLENFPVPPELEKQWQTDVLINARGVAVDMDMVRGALWIGETTRDQLTDEAVTLSGLDNPNSVKQLMQWLEEELDEELTDLRKDTVSRLLNGNLTNDTARRMLEIRQELGKTSTKKYNAIEAAVCADGRVRGLLQFYGANRTGRWAGRLVQVQNLPRTYVEPLPLARDLVKRRETASLRALFGSVPDTLSQLIRTSFIAEPGNALVDADFSAIEARVISWLAGESWRLDVFRTHGKIYEASASQMFGVPLERIKKGNPEYALRQKGKVAELALGYQGSTGALIKMGALDMGLTEAELPDIVNRWRDANKRIRDLWYSMEAAAVQVIQTGQPVGLRSLVLAREMDAGNNLDFLTIRLPSGRKLYYAHPSLGQNQWGKPSITYMGMDQTTKKWKLIETYGGKLVENCVQAIARDCLAEAIERLEAANYPVVFHVHDEVVVECTAERASLDDIAAIMGQPVSWAPDLPLGADGWVGAFYKKD